ncbi:hypothetical protein C2S51_029846 [Perilla frutescens var. frutescens]|nr:hypothetical protein C2S51_029846 [Perilla frutescens var. frutescens]
MGKKQAPKTATKAASTFASKYSNQGRLETCSPAVNTRRRTKPPQFVDINTGATSPPPSLQHTPATPLTAPVTIQPPERSSSPLQADSAAESSATPSPPPASLSCRTHSHMSQAGPPPPLLQPAEAAPSSSRQTYVQRPPFRPRDQVQQRANQNADRYLFGARVFDWNNIAVLGVNDRIRAHFASIGWSALLDFALPVHRELSLELLSSYVFDAARELDDAHVVLFTLSGLYELSHYEVPASFFSHANERWSALSIDSEFVPRTSRSAHLRDDALRLCHRFLAYTFFGRIDGSNVVTVQELFIRDSMFLGETLNFGSWLCRQWQYSANHFLCKAPLGHLITLLAQHLHVPLAEPEFLSATLFTVDDFVVMKLLCVNAQGQYQLSQPGVQGPSPLSNAGTTSSAALPLLAIETLFERFTQRLDTRLDSIDDHLTALEQAVRHLASTP